jgi:hypothetical protein
VIGQLTQRSDAARGRLLQQAHITAEDLAAARTTLRELLRSLAASDRNFRPGVPATGAELPVNDRSRPLSPAGFSYTWPCSAADWPMAASAEMDAALPSTL